MNKEEIPELEPWEQEIVDGARDIPIYSISSLGISGESPLPYNGTIFTAKLPDEPLGGVGSDLKIKPTRILVKGSHSQGIETFESYTAHTTLATSNLFGDVNILRRLRQGDLGRFIVWDQDLETAHRTEERNWFNARLLRPLYIRPPLDELACRDRREQVIVAPEDFEIMLMAGLSRYLKKGYSSRPQINDEVIANDLTQIMSLPEETLKNAYKTFKGMRIEE